MAAPGPFDLGSHASRGYLLSRAKEDGLPSDPPSHPSQGGPGIGRLCRSGDNQWGGMGKERTCYIVWLMSAMLANLLCPHEAVYNSNTINLLNSLLLAPHSVTPLPCTKQRTSWPPASCEGALSFPLMSRQHCLRGRFLPLMGHETFFQNTPWPAGLLLTPNLLLHKRELVP